MLVRSYDMVGDMAIIIIPDELIHREQLIGEAILANNRRIKVVARRDGNYSGELRLIRLKIIAGEERKETVHREYGVQFVVNPEEVYFSVRSGTERFRLAKLVQPGEDVLVLFAGAGPYPLVIAANSEAASITGIEKNSKGVEFARRSLQMNKRLRKRDIRFLCGDVAEVLPGLDRQYDRVIMPLPKGGDLYLGAAVDKLKPGGWIHYYSMQPKSDFMNARETVEDCCRERGRLFTFDQSVKCGHCAPGTHRVCTEGRVGEPECR